MSLAHTRIYLTCRKFYYNYITDYSNQNTVMISIKPTRRKVCNTVTDCGSFAILAHDNVTSSPTLVTKRFWQPWSLPSRHVAFAIALFEFKSVNRQLILNGNLSNNDPCTSFNTPLFLKSFVISLSPLPPSNPRRDTTPELFYCS